MLSISKRLVSKIKKIFFGNYTPPKAGSASGTEKIHLGSCAPRIKIKIEIEPDEIELDMGLCPIWKKLLRIRDNILSAFCAACAITVIWWTIV